jgi:hypothetical protein
MISSDWSFLDSPECSVCLGGDGACCPSDSLQVAVCHPSGPTGSATMATTIPDLINVPRDLSSDR